ncbi:uncharacterized protein LOC133716872 [Rosa rugosa]|uniref:uncharacterized protein LOC133716872 n=1 Tax=Rosa rugosa TaxID=74645 RepID=UPI002B416C9B|nr:uncharacterized protein LOC133716872 [Rosa rugosa]
MNFSGVLLVLHLFDNPNVEISTIEHILLLSWSIWNNRNRSVFRQLVPSPSQTCYGAANFGTSYWLANRLVPKQKISRSFHIKWKPPDDNQVKLNFDGSVKHGVASTGFCIRDSNGNPIIAATRRIGHAGVLTAEATALRDGLSSALLNQHLSIWVEGDCKLLIDCILKKTPPPWRIKLLVDDIACLAAKFHSIRFRHIFREANFVADKLADLGFRSSTPLVWFHCLPVSVFPAFHLDQLGGGCCRGFSL